MPGYPGVNQEAAGSSQVDRDRVTVSDMNLAQLRLEKPHWTFNRWSDGILCQYGPWRFKALDPDDALEGIELREKRTTLAELGAYLAAAGY